MIRPLFAAAAALAAVLVFPGAPAGATAPTAVTGERTLLIASDGEAGNRFGASAATDGNIVVVVGAPSATTNSRLQAGAVYVYETDGTRTKQTRLSARFPGVRDYFGQSVAVSGDTIVVGANHDDNPIGNDSGSVYVFVRQGHGWVQQAQLTAPDGARGAGFGISVAIDGHTIVVFQTIVAFSGGEGNPSATYVYERTAGTWTYSTRLEVPNFSGLFFSGDGNVDVDGDTLVIGAGGDVAAPNGGGSVYVYVRDGAGWARQA